MTEQPQHPRGTRQLAGLAASGGLVFYVLLVVAVAMLVGILFALNLLQVADSAT